MATACYDYQTSATVQVCVDPNPASNQDDVCQAKSFTVSGGQAAPVAITGVAQQPSAGTSQFVITIKNLGGGDVLKRDKVGQCLDQLTPIDVDVVEVAGGTLGSQSLVCSPTTVKLVKGQGITTCRISGLTGNAYATALMLTLRYGYKSSITKTVSIRRI
jgi:hypothetical protein